MVKFVIQPVNSSYPTLGNAYSHACYEIEYLSRLVITGKNYFDSREGILSDQRMSTAAEELAIQLDLERSGKDPREAKVFDDLFARNEAKIYLWQWTDTGLRLPAGRDPNKYETDAQGRKYWAREVLIGGEVVGEILVPEGGARVVVEWDEVFGLPRVTDDIDLPHKPYTTHFWFNPDPDIDNRSGYLWFNPDPSIDNSSSYRDVVVGRSSVWRPYGRCLGVHANSTRLGAYPEIGLRPVRGSLPKIEKIQI